MQVTVYEAKRSGYEWKPLPLRMTEHDECGEFGDGAELMRYGCLEIRDPSVNPNVSPDLRSQRPSQRSSRDRS